MTASFQFLRDLFGQCVDLPDGERARWLDQHVTDTDVRVELELMLAADRAQEGFLQHDVVSHMGRFNNADLQDFRPEGLIGRCFGAFRLTQLIGLGGQGAVYLAQRIDGDFAQTAAVKLLRRGIHDAQEHQRFRREREILARFEHAGVARLIDGGVSAEGVPFLVLEYVEGQPIDDWCKSRGLDRKARLQLFLELCEVIAATQRALIVHRDIKPSNVLVTPAGRIKVLDFGIARLLDEEDGAHTAVPMLTPGYGAPEQVSGGPITFATDVHALGVLLRVLLTDEAPPQPGDSGKRLPPDFAAELRWMLGKACAVEPERRYRDAAEFGEDAARFLAARPVRAHPPSTWYHARKFFTRHRGSVLTATAVLLGLFASFSLALWQAKVAREQAHRAEATRDFLLGLFEAAQEDLPRDARPTPDILVKAAARKLQDETQLAPSARADFLAALGHVARFSNDPASAVPLYEQALTTLDSAGDTTSRDRLRIEVARAWTLLPLGRWAEAEQALQPRLPALRAVTDELSVDALWAYADAAGGLGRMDDYLEGLRQARELAARVHPPHAVENLRLAGAYSLALSDAGRLRESNDVLEAMLQRWRDSGAPKQTDYAIGLTNLGLLKRRLGDLDAAEALMRESLQLSLRIHDEEHPIVAGSMQLLGRTLAERGNTAEAGPLLQRSETVLKQVYGADHPLSIAAVTMRGLLELEQRNYPEAVALLQRAEDICKSGGRDGETRCLTNLQLLGDGLRRLGRLDEAVAASRRSLDGRRALAGADSPDCAIPLRAVGDAELARGKPAEALAAYDEAQAIYAKAGMIDNLEIASLYASRSRALLQLGRSAEALQSVEYAAAATTRLAPAHEGRRLRLLTTRIAVLAALSRRDEAIATAQEALALEPLRGVLDPGEWESLQAITR